VGKKVLGSRLVEKAEAKEAFRVQGARCKVV